MTASWKRLSTLGLSFKRAGRRSWLEPASLVMIFLALRIPLLFYNRGEPPDVWGFLRDAEGFLQTGVRYFLAQGSERQPLFPLFIMLGLPFFDGILWARFVVLLCAGGSVWLIYQLYGLLLPDKKGRWLAALLVILHPIFTLVSIRPLSEVVLLFSTLLCFYVYYRRDLRFRPLFLGLAAGMAAMSRGEGLLAAIIFLGAALLEMRRRDLLLLAGFFAITALPYMIVNYITRGKPLYPYTLELRDTRLVGPRAFSLREWKLLAGAQPFRIAYLFSFLPGVVWAGRGLILGVKSLRWRLSPLLVYLFLMTGLLSVWNIVHDQRIYLYLLPFLCSALAFGMTNDLEGLNNKAQKAGMIVASLIVLAFYLEGVEVARQNQAFLWLLQVDRDYLRATLPILRASFWASALVVALASPWLPRRLVSAGLILTVLGTYLVLLPLTLREERYRAYRCSDDGARYAEKLSGLVAYAMDTPAARWYLRKNGVLAPYDWPYTDEEQITWLREKNISYVMWSSDVPQGEKSALAGRSLSLVREGPFAGQFELLARFIGSREMQWDIVAAQDRAEGEFALLRELSPVGQSFYVAEQGAVQLREVRLLFEKTLWGQEEMVTVTLWDSPAKKEMLAQNVVRGDEINLQGNEDAWAVQSFRLEAPIQSERAYYLEVTYDGQSSNALTIYRGLSDLYPRGAMFINGAQQEQDLWFKIFGSFRGRTEIYRLRTMP